jgi:hypothetical protein
MSQIFVPYKDGAGTMYGVQQEATIENILNDMAAHIAVTPRIAPFGLMFATLADLQAVTGWSGAIAAPAGLVTRKIAVAISDNNATPPSPAVAGNIGSFNAVVGDEVTFNALEPTGVAPFPEATSALSSVQAVIVGATGESRNSN